MNNWLTLILALPTANATERMRAWRALKASGAAVLRDGAYLLPDTGVCREALASVERDILSINGTVYILPVVDPRVSALSICSTVAMTTASYAQRSKSAVGSSILKTHWPPPNKFASCAKPTISSPTSITSQVSPSSRLIRPCRSLRRLSAEPCLPDEPHSRDQPITALNLGDYQRRVWATRKRPWVDRLACAWLIRRFIDPQAQILWLNSPTDCPADALGFDFDDATFSHVGNRVTFETLQASFELQEPGLNRIAALVHYLDIGGIQPVEAAGIERVLAGLRETITHDDHLLAAASAIFDGLLAEFVKEEQPNE